MRFAIALAAISFGLTSTAQADTQACLSSYVSEPGFLTGRTSAAYDTFVSDGGGAFDKVHTYLQNKGWSVIQPSKDAALLVASPGTLKSKGAQAPLTISVENYAESTRVFLAYRTGKDEGPANLKGELCEIVESAAP
jgi:hypothetical protein